jgi:tetratricopeptide (TPR) repeat protein
VKRALLIALVVSATAHANVWQQALDNGSPDSKREIYKTELQSGDELAEQATAQAASREAIRTMVQHAAQSYRNAAAVEPTEGEPWFRLGRLLYSFYFECSGNALNPSPLCNPDPQFFDRKHAEEVLEAWATFEKLSPLDPRLGVMRDDGITAGFDLLFHRAILNTHFADHAHLELAAKDYEAILARSDKVDDTVTGNLAETYMMLDRLDDAIETYRRALRESLRSETVYGLAVALDRDERGGQARDLILSQGEQALQEFERSIATGRTFFVPAGEEFYYLALAYEAYGLNEVAIEHWHKYIASGAHAEFQPRAKAHLDALEADKRRKILKLETPWHDLFH